MKSENEYLMATLKNGWQLVVPMAVVRRIYLKRIITDGDLDLIEAAKLVVNEPNETFIKFADTITFNSISDYVIVFEPSYSETIAATLWPESVKEVVKIDDLENRLITNTLD